MPNKTNQTEITLDDIVRARARQKTYRGRPTVKARVQSLIDAGEIDNYEIDELAALLGCTERTIQAYIHEMVDMPLLAAVCEEDIPLLTTSGWMLIIMDWDFGTCDMCPAEELCRTVLGPHGHLVACEKPLKREVI